MWGCKDACIYSFLTYVELTVALYCPKDESLCSVIRTLELT
jgi:hypothetical protein